MIDIDSLTPDKRDVLDTINEMMDASYGCAESFVAAVGKYLHGNVEESIQMISTGFSGGVGGTHEELCGGVSGAAIMFGLLYGRTTNDESKMVRCKRLISEHRDLFVQEFGTTVCQELRDAEYGADEKNPCSALIGPAAFLFLDVLEAEQERERLSAANQDQAECADVVSFEEFIRKNQDLPAEQLLSELDQENLPHAYRDWIGDQLDSRGDKRPGVNVIEAGVPDLALLPVKKGTVEIERAGEFVVDEIMISKYPITYQQFQLFVDDPRGFRDPVWWQGLAADPDHRSQPGEQRFAGNNYPRDNVSWFDAAAFCRWLTEKVRNLPSEDNLPEKTLIQDQEWVIRLPTEWEWQMAATGGQKDRKFPWGLDWNDCLAHTKHNQLNKSMAVGMYPAGVSPIGALDMSGNVWEWCLNCYQDPGDLNLARTDRRVLRGGSWYHWGSYAHTDMRSRYYPGHRYNAGGFRIVCAKPI